MHRLLLALLFVVPHANAYDLKLPSPDWEAAQVVVRAFQADLAAWEKEAAFFDFPATEPAWPCNVGTDERYQAAGLMMALPDFAAKQAKLTRKHFRELGMDAEPVKKNREIRGYPHPAAACRLQGGQAGWRGRSAGAVCDGFPVREYGAVQGALYQQQDDQPHEPYPAGRFPL